MSFFSLSAGPSKEGKALIEQDGYFPMPAEVAAEVSFHPPETGRLRLFELSFRGFSTKKTQKSSFLWTRRSFLRLPVRGHRIPPMFSLSQTTGYAIKALVCLAGGCEVRQVRDIAGCTDTPVHYLAKVVHRLAGAGILESKRGHKGGVWLVRKPEEISLLEISEAVDGRAQFGSCLLGFDNCSDERACPTHKFWKAARAEIRRQLASISLADVLEFEKRRARKGACSALTPQPTTR